MPRTFLAGEAKWFPEGSLAELPDIEADRDAFDIRRYQLESPVPRRLATALSTTEPLPST